MLWPGEIESSFPAPRSVPCPRSQITAAVTIMGTLLVSVLPVVLVSVPDLIEHLSRSLH